MELDDALGRLEEPLLRRQPWLHAHRLVVRASRTVRDEDAPLGEQALEVGVSVVFGA